MTTSARQLAAPDSTGWSWITSAARTVPQPGLPAITASFPRAATWPVARDCGLRSVAVVRASARAALQCWGITEHGDDIVLVLSELLANAMLHSLPGPGRCDVTAGLLQPGPDARILCAVTDPGQDLPRPPACPGRPASPQFHPGSGAGTGLTSARSLPRPDSPDRESGRGLCVIAELSQTWGYVPGPAGKIAWALLGDPARPAARVTPAAPGPPHQARC